MIVSKINEQNDVMLKLLYGIPQRALNYLGESSHSVFWKVLYSLEGHWIQMAEENDVFLGDDGFPVDPSLDEVHSSHWMSTLIEMLRMLLYKI